MEPGIHQEDRPGGVRVLTVSNPKKRNALDPELLRQLREALSPERALGVRALLVRGDGDHFCSGYDLSGLDRIPDQGPLPDDALQDAFSAVEAFPAVTVALVRGAAIGAGCELAASCDLRVFTDDAFISIPPAKLGVVYAPEGLARVSALAGPSRAKVLFFTGRRVKAAQALEWGLCEELHPAASAERAALELCSELAQNAPLALQGMKRAFRALSRGPIPEAEREELRRLRRAAFQSGDAREGRQAIQEKRPPRFSGR